VLAVVISTCPAAAQSLDYHMDVYGSNTVYAGSTSYVQITPVFTTGGPAPVFLSAVRLGGKDVPFSAACGSNVVCSTDRSGRYFLSNGPESATIITSIPADTPSGSQVLAIVTDIAGVLRTTTVNLRVNAAPAPLPPVAWLPSVAIPNLTKWQTTMLTLAAQWCPAAGTVLDFNNEQQVWYYDGARVYYQIADFTADKKWEACALTVARQYRDYVVSRNGSIPGWRIFTRGLRLAYERTGDASFKDAALLLVKNAPWANCGGFVTDDVIRETSYVANAYIETERMGAERNPLLARSVDYLLGHFNQLFVSGEYKIHQTFFDGIGAEALINYYELTKDPRIPPTIKLMLDWMWDSGWDKTNHMMVYNPDPVGPRCEGGCQVYITDLVNMVAPAYAWYWSVTGDTLYQQRGDEMFAHALDTGITYSGKIFSQNYKWSDSYVRWRAAVGSTPTPAPAAFTPIRVNAGSSSPYTDASGQVWSADSGSTGGYVFTSSSAIANTTAATLYQSERWNPGALQYRFSVPNGTYTVRLKFAEIYYARPGQRVFNVVVNGQLVDAAFDVVAAAGSGNTAVDRSYSVAVSTGQVAIDLIAIVENPKISAIEIVSAGAATPPPVNTFTPVRVNAGATTAYTDALGQVWEADTGATGGYGFSTSTAIAGTTTPALYQTERWSNGPLQYNFAVPNGSYTVRLKFAEIYLTQPGQRVFNIVINGQLVAASFDPIAAAGAANTAVDRSYTVTVAGGQIAIALNPIVQNPKISAIEIVSN
jgi:hypothetical protein